MLIELNVENYRSIRETATFSMVASRGRDLPGNCLDCPSDSRLRLLRCAAIYGANASGKSNLIAALLCMTDRVRRGTLVGGAHGVSRITPFRLDPVMRGRPSRFEVVFATSRTRLVYGFSAFEEAVHEEWLHAYPRGRKKIVFERATSASPEGESLKTCKEWPDGKRKSATALHPSELLLPHASSSGVGEADSARDWFHSGVRCIGAFPDFSGELDATTEMIRIDPEARRRLVEFLKLADLGISDFRVEPDGRVNPDDPASVSRLRARITLIHEARTAEGEPVEIPLESFEEESSGTQKFFALAGPWFEALSRGTLLVVDELDLRLHPLLTRRLIELFYDPRLNPRCAQLIFTTHDSSLLSGEIFRRDQIWFAEKTPDGSTSLYSLADFRPQRGENIRTGYLEGRYGAIPFVGDLPE